MARHVITNSQRMSWRKEPWATALPSGEVVEISGEDVICANCLYWSPPHGDGRRRGQCKATKHKRGPLSRCSWFNPGQAVGELLKNMRAPVA